MSKGTDRSREARLWVTIILSAIGTGALVMSDPEVRLIVGKKIHDIKEHFSIKKKIREDKKQEEQWKKEHPDIKVVNSETIKQEL